MQSLNSLIWVCTVNDLLDLCLLIPFGTLGLIGTVYGDTNNLINQEPIRGYFSTHFRRCKHTGHKYLKDLNTFNTCII